MGWAIEFRAAASIYAAMQMRFWLHGHDNDPPTEPVRPDLGDDGQPQSSPNGWRESDIWRGGQPVRVRDLHLIPDLTDAEYSLIRLSGSPAYHRDEIASIRAVIDRGYPSLIVR